MEELQAAWQIVEKIFVAWNTINYSLNHIQFFPMLPPIFEDCSGPMSYLFLYPFNKYSLSTTMSNVIGGYENK